jgi:hypothetical protein
MPDLSTTTQGPILDHEGADLQIQKTLVTEQTVLDGYLSRGHGNSYNFDQESRLENFYAL